MVLALRPDGKFRCHSAAGKNQIAPQMIDSKFVSREEEICCIAKRDFFPAVREEPRPEH